MATNVLQGEVSSKSDFENFLHQKGQPTVLPAWRNNNLYYPIDQLPIVRVLDENNNPSYYALWHKRDKEGGAFDKFVLLSQGQLGNLSRGRLAHDSDANNPMPAAVIKNGWSRNGQDFKEVEAVQIFYNPITGKQADAKFSYWSKSGEMTQNDSASFIGQSGYKTNPDGKIEHPQKGVLLSVPMAIVDKKALTEAGGEVTPEVLKTDLRSAGYTYGPTRMSSPSAAPVTLEDRQAESKYRKSASDSVYEMLSVRQGQKKPVITVRASEIEGLPNVKIERSAIEERFHQRPSRGENPASPDEKPRLPKGYKRASEAFDGVKGKIAAVVVAASTIVPVAAKEEAKQQTQPQTLTNVYAQAASQPAPRPSREERARASAERGLQRAQEGMNNPATAAAAEQKARESVLKILQGQSSPSLSMKDMEAFSAITRDPELRKEFDKREKPLLEKIGQPPTDSVRRKMAEITGEILRANMAEIAKVEREQGRQAAIKFCADISEKAVLESFKKEKGSHLSPTEISEPEVKLVAAPEPGQAQQQQAGSVFKIPAPGA